MKSPTGKTIQPITFADLADLGIEIVVLDSSDKVREVHRAVAKALNEEYQADWEEDLNGRHR